MTNKNNTESRWWYMVQEIDSGVVTYRGTCLAIASEYLVPGTCYGKGMLPEAAGLACVSWRLYFLRKQEEQDNAIGIGCDQTAGE